MVLRILIQFYWLLTPKHRRNSCLFRESCSNHVFRITGEKGLVEGILTLRKRFQLCRTEYKLLSGNGKTVLCLCDGTQLSEDEIATNLLATLKPMDAT